MSARTRIKVCCIASIAEARTALALGADALGLVSAMPNGLGPIPEDMIAEIAPSVPPPVTTDVALDDGDAAVKLRRDMETAFARPIGGAEAP